MLITDLFSSIDQGNGFMWILPILLIFPITTGRRRVVLSIMTANIEKSVLGGVRRVISPIIVLFLILNLSGLVPLSYPLTRRPWLVMITAIIGWLRVLSYIMRNNYKDTIAHLSPTGAPFVLSPILVLIETISILIRPLTLTVRLVANISVGHVICGLLCAVLDALIQPIFLHLTLLFYRAFEIGVRVVQAYIFALLLVLYRN